MEELVAVLVQLVGELLLQIVFELLGELGLHSIKEAFRRPQPLNPMFAALGYGILGMGAGAVSLILVPDLLIHAQWVRIANLVLTPVGAGLFMAVLGSWRSRKGQDLIRLDKFGYGFLFALSMACVRFFWAPND